MPKICTVDFNTSNSLIYSSIYSDTPSEITDTTGVSSSSVVVSKKDGYNSFKGIVSLTVNTILDTISFDLEISDYVNFYTDYQLLTFCKVQDQYYTEASNVTIRCVPSTATIRVTFTSNEIAGNVYQVQILAVKN
jgi:hypothetical protein